MSIYKCRYCEGISEMRIYNHEGIKYKGYYHKILEYNKLVSKLAQLEKSIKITKSTFPIPLPVYGKFEVILSNKQDKVTILGVLLNKNKMKEYLDEWEVMTGFLNDWSDTQISVSYYKTEEGILTHIGHGWKILKEPCVISNEEWEQFKIGNIPERLILEQEQEIIPKLKE